MKRERADRCRTGGVHVVIAEIDPDRRARRVLRTARTVNMSVSSNEQATRACLIT
jgi:hypothetical protein